MITINNNNKDRNLSGQQISGGGRKRFNDNVKASYTAVIRQERSLLSTFTPFTCLIPSVVTADSDAATAVDGDDDCVSPEKYLHMVNSYVRLDYDGFSTIGIRRHACIGRPCAGLFSIFFLFPFSLLLCVYFRRLTATAT